MDLASGLDAVTPEVEELRRKVFALERELLKRGDLAGQLDAERKRADQIERELGIVESLGIVEQPTWLTKPPKSGRKHHATPHLLLSDLHLDEVVDPDEVSGVNAYNRDIAEQRLARTAENFVKVTRDYWSGLTYDGCVIMLGGDIFSGEIHDELRETNADTLLGSLHYWLEPMASVIATMADEFGKVHVPVVVGNHGRTTRKPRAKLRVRSNFDWALGHALARSFAKDSRVTFDIPESADCRFEVYDSAILLTHGDQVNGGSGIGGIWPPLMRLAARKRARGDAVGQPFDLMACGHWHQLVYGPDFVVNGSLKGYDEYAAVSNFSFEQPQQAAWLMVPGYGKTWTAPIFSQEREAEGW
jgi:hypothetical protein